MKLVTASPSGCDQVMLSLALVREVILSCSCDITATDLRKSSHLPLYVVDLRPLTTNVPSTSTQLETILIGCKGGDMSVVLE